jgi:hypothetical protein
VRRAECVTQVVEHPLSKPKDLSSNSTTTKRKEKTTPAGHSGSYL